MLSTSFIIAVLCSFMCLGVCSKAPLSNDHNDNLFGVMSSGNDGIDQEKSNNLSSELEDIVETLEPVISDPVFEDTSWNNSVLKGLSRKRDLPEGGLNHESKMNLLQLHNLYRSNVTPPAGNMAYMEWDEELARLAQKWSDGCIFEHGMPDNDYPTTIGQNLYLGSDPTGYLGLWMWFEEYKNYDMRKHYCKPRTQCGHYQQMAWSQSDRVGCGIAKCDKLRYILTCHYRYQAMRGVQIYNIAKPCSQCPSKNGALCLKNLCITWEQCKQNPFDCHFAKCDLECHNCGRLDKENCMCDCADGWDSPDCSRTCTDKNTHCGRKPGFPKESCFMYQHTVAEEKCRKMCGMCNSVDIQISNDTCCDGIVCDEGYVLDPITCKCYLLCPGPVCDGEEEVKVQASLHSGTIYLTANILLVLQMSLALYICLSAQGSYNLIHSLNL